jgi:hypothetical protein
MPKLDIDFEITGLKLKIKGESDDVGGKIANLQTQVQNLIGTIASLTQGAATVNGAPPQTSVAPSRLIEAEASNATDTKNRRPSPLKGKPAAPKAEAIDFKHDAEKYGFPKQEWYTAQKAMWLLFMLTNDGIATEMTAPIIAATFNKHFKSFKTILSHNVSRDLAKEKGKTGAVNSDAMKSPETWHLLESGKRQMAALIAEAKVSASV